MIISKDAEKTSDKIQHQFMIKKKKPLQKMGTEEAFLNIRKAMQDNPQQSFFLYVHAKSLQSCLTLCNPMNRSSPGSSTHGILQARILEQLPCPPLGDLPNPEIRPASLLHLLHWKAGSLSLVPPGVKK